jgi:hypothetical protein
MTISLPMIDSMSGAGIPRALRRFRSCFSVADVTRTTKSGV